MKTRISKRTIDWEKVQHLAQSAVGTIKVVPEGIQDVNPWEFSNIKVLITAQVTSSIDMEHRYALPSIVESSIHEFARKNESDEQTPLFKQVFEKRVKKYFSQELIQFKILYLLHANPQYMEFGQPIKLGDISAVPVAWDDLDSLFPGIQDLWIGAEENLGVRINRLSPLWSFVPLTTVVLARTQKRAIDCACRHIEVLRASINYILDKGSLHFSCGPAKPQSKCIQPPVIGIFNEDGDYLNYACSQGDKKYRNYPFSSRNMMKRSIQFAEGIYSCESEMQMFLERIINLYCHSMDCEDLTLAFLAFWQAIEVAALKDWPKRQSHIKVAGRISNLISANKIEQDVLKVMVDERNDFVHQGQYSHNLELHLNVLKLLLEKCIHVLHPSSNRYSTLEDLKKSYQGVNDDTYSH